MKLSTESNTILEIALNKVIGSFSADHCQPCVTDIQIQPHPTSGEFTIIDDNDNELACGVISEWQSEDSDQFYKDIENLLRAKLGKLKEQGVLDNLAILKPYSFVLIDEEKETVCELMLVDDDTLIINNELLKGLDDELNDFLKKLLEN